MKKLLLAIGVSVSLMASIDLKIDNTSINDKTVQYTSFAPIVQKVIPSVVNISTEKIVKTKVPDAFRKFFDDPFFKKFFGPVEPLPREKEQKEFSLGSGIIITKNGYIVTNYHVVSGATKIIVKLHDNRKFTAKLIGSDPKTDIAVIKIDTKDLKPITITDSSKIRVGDIVLAIGNPFGLGETVTHGIVSALNRTSIGLNDYENFIQTDAAINPGNSGGALVDLKGRLIGINSAIISRSGGNNGIGFAIPSNMMKFVAISLIKYKKVTRGYLGVIISDIDVGKAKLYGISRGVLVNRVEPDGAASEAGIKPGDIIVAVNGEEVKNAGELRNKIAFKEPNSKVNLKIYRNGTYITVSAKLKKLENKIQKIQDIKLLKGVLLKEESKQVVVENIDKNSFVAIAGLQKGDVILRVKTIKTGKWIKITSIEQLKELLKDLDRGDALFEIKRKNYIFIIQM